MKMNTLKTVFLVILPLILTLPTLLHGKLCEYHIEVKEIIVNNTGKSIPALSFNGQIPGPTIEATLGDTLRVHVTNHIDEPTSIHWHGVLLPNDQDGVPFLTTPPILPGTSFTFEYPIIHTGTYWYHSHSGLQEQRGLYGSLVFHREKTEIPMKEIVLVLSDWTNEYPVKVLSHLKRDDDFYALKKDAVQSWYKVLQNGPTALKSRLNSSFTRMGPMDISDVGYDAFWINGRQLNKFENFQGEKVKLRIINAGASSYFYLQFANGPMQIVASDGVDVAPIKIDKLRIAIAETYDIIVDVPESGSFEFRATSEDATGFASAYFGKGDLHTAPNIPKPNPFLMTHDHHSPHGNHHAMHKEREYDFLKAKKITKIDPAKPLKEIHLKLTGMMDGYMWHFNNKPFSESDKILIQKGQKVQILIENETMMHHPIHLHGHFFRVLNKHGDYSPLKHTVNVPPMGSVTIEFDANEEKDWFFHCHNLYHMKNGMTRIFSYGDDPNLGSLKHTIAHDDQYYWAFEGSILSNMTDGHAKLFNNNNAIMLEYDYGYEKSFEIEFDYNRRFSRFLSGFVGIEVEREDDEDTEVVGVAGFRYVLPLLIESQWRIDTEGGLRLSLNSHLQLTDRIFFNWQADTDKEYRIGLLYEFNKHLSMVTQYDSDYKWGLGVRLALP